MDKNLLMETESYAAYLAPESERKEFDKSLKLKYKDMEIGLHGFTQVLDNNKKMIFIYKIKGDEKCVFYYKAEDISKENNEKFEIFMKSFNSMTKNQYHWHDIKETFESTYQEQRTFDKLAKAQNKI